MQKGEWNLRLFGPSLNVYIVSPSQKFDREGENIMLRMKILSHQISFNGIPAVFTENMIKDKIFEVVNGLEGPFVTCFDIDGKFEELSLPPWITVSKTEWIVQNMYRKEIVDSFQKAFTLFQNYKLFEFSPIYFSTFLYFEDDPIFASGSCFVKYCPVLHNEILGIRTVTQNDSTSIPMSEYMLQKGRFILISPYEDPFIVVSAVNDVLTVQDFDSTIQHFKISETKFVVLTKFSKNFIKENIPVKEVRYSFEPIKSFTFAEEQWTDFFHNNFFLSNEETRASERNQSTSYIEDEPIKPFDFLTDQCDTCLPKYLLTSEASEERKALIEKQIETVISVVGNDDIPSPTFKRLRLNKVDAISTVDFNFGFPTSKMMPHVPEIAGELSEFEYTTLSIPNLSVIQDNTVRQVQANTVFCDWVEQRRAPISGQKNLHFSLFSDGSVDKRSIIHYVGMISESYTKYRLGTMKAKVVDSVKACSKEMLEGFISVDLRSHKGDEFHDEKDVLIIVSDTNFEDRIRGYSVFIRPEWIKKARMEQIEELAFQIYSKIRVFRSAPYGSFELTEPKEGLFEANPNINALTKMFFGVSLSPAYTLPATSNLTLHIAIYNCEQKMIAVFTDSTASILQPVLISNFSDICSRIAGSANINNGVIADTIITIYADGISQEFYHRLRSGLSDLPVTIMSMFPMTMVQTKNMQDCDYFVDCSEIPFNKGNMAPSYRCLVGSTAHQVYTLAIYEGSHEKLFSIAQEFSAMSWVTVKPGMEHRSTSFPPHISGLLRVSSVDIKDMSAFAFLPPSSLDF